MSRVLLKDEFAHVRDDGLTGEQYVRDYNRGWVATSLEAGDHAGASEAWYDGYADSGAGRKKWHLPRCMPNHHNGPGGCGEA